MTWATEPNNDYSPSKFFTGGTDGKGAKSSLDRTYSFHAPSTLGALISKVVQGRRFPYETSSDFFRDACIHRLRWLAEQPESDIPLPEADHLRAILQVQRLHRSLQADAEATEKAVAGLRGAHPEEWIGNAHDLLVLVTSGEARERLREAIGAYRQRTGSS